MLSTPGGGCLDEKENQSLEKTVLYSYYILEIGDPLVYASVLIIHNFLSFLSVPMGITRWAKLAQGCPGHINDSRSQRSMYQLQRHTEQELSEHIVTQMEPTGVEQGIAEESPELQALVGTIYQKGILWWISTHP